MSEVTTIATFLVGAVFGAVMVMVAMCCLIEGKGADTDAQLLHELRAKDSRKGGISG